MSEVESDYESSVVEGDGNEPEDDQPGSGVESGVEAEDGDL